MPHKSPGKKALVIPNSDTQKRNVQMLSHLPRSLNLTFDDMIRDDVSMDSLSRLSQARQMNQVWMPTTARPTRFLIDGSRQWEFVLTTLLIQEIVLQTVIIRKKTYSTKIRITKW